MEVREGQILVQGHQKLVAEIRGNPKIFILDPRLFPPFHILYLFLCLSYFLLQIPQLPSLTLHVLNCKPGG